MEVRPMYFRDTGHVKMAGDGNDNLKKSDK